MDMRGRAGSAPGDDRGIPLGRAMLVCFTAIPLGIALLLSAFVSRSFESLEVEAVHAQSARVSLAIGAAVASLDAQLRDWAAREESGRFAEERDGASVEAAGMDADFASLRFHWLASADPAGEIVWQKRYDLEGQVALDMAPAMAAMLRETPGLLGAATPDAKTSGLVMVEGMPMLITSRALVHSGGGASSRGTLLMARFVDAELIEQIKRTTRVPFGIHSVSANRPEDLQRARAELLEGTEAYCEPLGAEDVAATRVLRGIDGAPIALLRAVLPRVVYQHGMRARGYLLGTAGAAGIVSALLGWWFLLRLGRSLAARRQTERLARAIIAQSVDGVVLLDPETRTIERANDAACKLLGLEPSGPMDEWRTSVFGEGEPTPGAREIRRAASDGSVRHIAVTVTELALDERRLLHAGLRDISAHKRAESQMRHNAYHDSLTQLPNRLLFHEHLVATLDRAQRSGGRVAMLVVDLDHFKAANDTLGHEPGDRTLVKVAARLSACLRPGEFLARQGGDEFLVLSPCSLGKDAASEVAQRLLDALATPFRIEEREVHVTASVGLAVFPESGADAVTLYRHADMAMHHAKQDGRGGWRAHDDRMNEHAADLLELNTELKHALAHGGLEVHYQAQVSADTGELVGLEALMRWRNEARGEVPPDRFLRVAEETGLIVPVGEWLIEQVFRQQREWVRAGLPAVRLAINLSARQLLHPELTARLRTLLAATGADARAIDLEVTESAALESASRARDVLHELKWMGFTIALDDFGTGYSALAYLRQFPFDRLKMDRAFLRDIAESAGSRSIVEAIVSLGHSLDLEVVAEGVEHARHVEVLRACGCDILQGFGIARPGPPAVAMRLLVAARKRAAHARRSAKPARRARAARE